jgi:hypothetical protein
VRSSLYHHLQLQGLTRTNRYWNDIETDKFANTVLNIGNPTLVIANGSVGVDLGLFFVRKYSCSKSRFVYPTNPRRILLLHSRGNICVLLGLLTHAIRLRLVEQAPSAAHFCSRQHCRQSLVVDSPARHGLPASVGCSPEVLHRVSHRSRLPMQVALTIHR